MQVGADGIRVTAEAYSLHLETTLVGFARAPFAHLYDRHGRPWSAINLLSSVHTTAAPDETWSVDDVEAVPLGEDVQIIVTTRSSAWEEHELRLLCTPGTVEVTVRVAGSGDIASVQLLGGQATLEGGACGTFRSSIEFAGVLVPVPTEPVHLVRPSSAAGVLGVVGDATPGRLHGIFSPPPLVYGFSREPSDGPTSVPGGDWLGLSLRGPVETLTFTTMRYEPLDGGFLIRLDYEGHTRAEGEWRSPTLVLRPSASGWGTIEDHREDLVAHGLAPSEGPHDEAWWHEPLFCGWGAQCARLARRLRHEPDTPGDPVLGGPVLPEGGEALLEVDEEEELVAKSAPSLARQDVYDEFLATLEENGLRPGTIVIDDRWQAEYGTAEPDLDHWPDLRGWIAERHAAGQKVLLWWKAWDPAGLPAEECVLDAAGRPIAADPSNPRYLARLAAIVRGLLSVEGLDADGFKVDFTQRAPSGQSLRSHGGVWGIAALHALLRTIYQAAKEAKPDALVVCHTVHPSFGDVCDMVRLNDVLKHDATGRHVPVVDQLAFRHAIATRALPHHAIDTDQWPMPSRSEWLDYVVAQPSLGVPALYYLESIDRTGEPIEAGDLAIVASTWAEYREGLTPKSEEA